MNRKDSIAATIQKKTGRNYAAKAMMTAMAMSFVALIAAGCPGSKSVEAVAPPLPTGVVAGYINGKTFNKPAAAAAAARVAEATTNPNQLEVDPDAKPLMGAVVTVNKLGLTTTTDVNGYFVIDGVPIGSHTLTVTKSGFDTISLSAYVKDKGSFVELPVAAIEPKNAGALTINSTPAGATIYVDNVNTKQVTPYTFNPIKAGSSVIYVTIPGYETPDSKSVPININEMSEWTFLLERLKPVLVGVEIRRNTVLGNWLLWTGTSTQFIADCLFSDGSKEVCTSAVTWESDDITVGTVNAHSGLFQAKAQGTAKLSIHIEADGINGAKLTYADFVYVTILKSELDTITVTPAITTVKAGLQQQFTARCKNTDGTERTCTDLVTWASSDNSKGTISVIGLFTGVAEGSTEITAEYQGKISPPASVTVAAPRLNSISVTPLSQRVAAGLSVQFVANCAYSNKTTEACTSRVEWISNDLSVGTIGSKSGLFTGVAVGSTTVFANLDGISSNNATAIVDPPRLKSIAVTPPTQNIFAGMAVTNLQASCTYTDNSVSVCSDIFWAFGGVNDSDKASIDPTTGYVINTKNGTVSVVAKSSDNLVTSPASVIIIKPTTTIHGFVYKIGTTIPVGSAEVSYNYNEGILTGKTGSDRTSGAYSLAGVPTAAVAITVKASTYQDYTATINPAITQEFNFELTPVVVKVTVSGVISDSVTPATLIDQAQVELLYRPLSGVDELITSTSSDQLGAYTMQADKADQSQYYLRITKAGYVTQEVFIGSLDTKTRNISLVPAP